jgi:hypothetical protein
MHSPNSLLIGSYTLLSYSYSQRHTYLTLGSWNVTSVVNVLTTGSCTETEKEKMFSLSFFKDDRCCKIHSYTCVLVCSVYCTAARFRV